ncbi:MAG: hypothetical protein ISP86_02085 [Shewanellaceae bacterium]|nr:hypothetical protein [Shewanellaceae bacterium]
MSYTLLSCLKYGSLSVIQPRNAMRQFPVLSKPQSFVALFLTSMLTGFLAMELLHQVATTLFDASMLQLPISSSSTFWISLSLVSLIMTCFVCFVVTPLMSRLSGVPSEHSFLSMMTLGSIGSSLYMVLFFASLLLYLHYFMQWLDSIWMSLISLSTLLLLGFSVVYMTFFYTPILMSELTKRKKRSIFMPVLAMMFSLWAVYQLIGRWLG